MFCNVYQVSVRGKECVQDRWDRSHKLYLQKTTLPDLIKVHYSCLISAVVRISILFSSMLLILFNLVILNPGPGGPQHCTFSSGTPISAPHLNICLLPYCTVCKKTVCYVISMSDNAKMTGSLCPVCIYTIHMLHRMLEAVS